MLYTIQIMSKLFYCIIWQEDDSKHSNFQLKSVHAIKSTVLPEIKCKISSLNYTSVSFHFKVLAHWLRNFHMRFFRIRHPFLSKCLLRMRKRRKSKFFYDGWKFRRQCVNMIVTTCGRIYFCNDLKSSQTLLKTAFTLLTWFKKITNDQSCLFLKCNS